MKQLLATRRAIYPYKCAGCSKRRLTRHYERAVEKLCYVCKPRQQKVPENQPALF